MARESRKRLVTTLFLLGILLGSPALGQDGKRTFTDTLGRTVRIPYPPRRIVSLVPDITETLFALGLSDEIVGVTQFSDYPPAARKKTKVGSYVDINFEAVVNLQPDVVLASAAGNSRMQVEMLERMGFPVFVVYPKDLDGVLREIERISAVVGRREEGEAIVSKMRKTIDSVVQRVAGRPRPRVFLQIGRDPIFTVSKGSFADHVISVAGGENIAKDAAVPYPSYSLEEVLLQAPDVIIVSSMNAKANVSRWLGEWKKWKAIPAVRNNRLFTIDSNLIDRPSPRIVEGLKRIAAMIHPEVFARSSR